MKNQNLFALIIRASQANFWEKRFRKRKQRAILTLFLEWSIKDTKELTTVVNDIEVGEDIHKVRVVCTEKNPQEDHFPMTAYLEIMVDCGPWSDPRMPFAINRKNLPPSLPGVPSEGDATFEGGTNE